MSQIVADVINYGTPVAAAAVGAFLGHKVTWKVVVKKAEGAFVKLAEDIKAGALAPVKALEHAPGAVEAHKTDVENVALETVKYALLGLTAMDKAYGSMNDAEKFALAQFVNNSLDAALPASMKVHVTPSGIAMGIEEAQNLLDGASTNLILQKALELTKLAAAVNASKVPTQPAQGQHVVTEG